MLAMGKAYAVSRSAIVPTVVRNDGELVEANSKLQLLSGLAVPAGRASRRGIAFAIGGSEGVLVVAVRRLRRGHARRAAHPATQVAAAPATAAESAELHGAGIRLAASAMGLVRGIVGLPHLPAAVRPARRPTLEDRCGAPPHAARARCSGPRWPRRCGASFAEERMLTLALVGGRGRRPRGGVDRRAGRRACCSPPSWRSCRRRAGSPSTRSCSATRPTPTGAGRSRASSSGSRSCGWWARVDPGADLDPAARRLPGHRRGGGLRPVHLRRPASGPPTGRTRPRRTRGRRSSTRIRRSPTTRRSNPSRSSIRRCSE